MEEANVFANTDSLVGKWQKKTRKKMLTSKVQFLLDDLIFSVPVTLLTVSLMLREKWQNYKQTQ